MTKYKYSRRITDRELYKLLNSVEIGLDRKTIQSNLIRIKHDLLAKKPQQTDEVCKHGNGIGCKECATKEQGECHCGKDGHALNSVRCPVHGYDATHPTQDVKKEEVKPEKIDCPNISAFATDEEFYWAMNITEALNLLLVKKEEEKEK